jgi:SAM-dependent methyltransferase
MFYSSRKHFRIDSGDGPPRYPVREALAKVRSAIYHGDNVECSCCGRRFRLFLFSPYQAALCPNCLSFERYRLLSKYLVEELGFGGTDTMLLDIAPIWAFQEFCRRFDKVTYLSIDLVSPMAMRHMDIRELELPDDEFDALVCYHVLEHIDDEMKALSELKRVMKPGAWAVIQVPIYVEKTISRDALTEWQAKRILVYDGHLRAHGPDEYRQLLESAGFRVDVVPYARKFSKEQLKEFGLDRTEDLYVCHK